MEKLAEQLREASACLDECLEKSICDEYVANPRMFESSFYPLVNVYKSMENHHVEWNNSLFQWQFSLAMLRYRRAHLKVLMFLDWLDRW